MPPCSESGIFDGVMIILASLSHKKIATVNFKRFY